MELHVIVGGKKNPLLFPSIVSEIFNYLPFRDLKESRLVCQVWELEAYRNMRKRSKILLDSYKKINLYSSALETRKDFSSAFEFGPKLNVDTPLTRIFFNDFGPFIKSLSLQKTKWAEPKLRHLLFYKLPNLEELTLDCQIPKGNITNGHYFLEEDVKSSQRLTLPKIKCINLNVKTWDSVVEAETAPVTAIIKNFIIDMLSICPNLEKISCPKAEFTSYHPLEFLFPLDPFHVNHFVNGEVVDALDELNGMGFEANIRRVLFDTIVSPESRVPSLNSLNELNLSMTLREEHLRKLWLKKYPLKRVEITITQNVTPHNLHENFLESISGTLEELNIRYLRRSSCTLTFPSALHLRKLTKLTITGFKGAFNFVSYLPNLKELVIVKIPSFILSFPPAHFKIGNILPCLHTLEIYEEERVSCGSLKLRSSLIEKFSTSFPNLKRLRLDHICDETLRNIYKFMPSLTELIARDGLFTDGGLTGIPDLACRIVTISSPTPSASKYKKSRTKDYDSIGSLTDLKVLELFSKKMTDFGISHGVLECKRLKKLTLMSYQITDDSLLRLIHELELQYLKTIYCYKISESAAELAASKIIDVSINEYEGPIKSPEMWKFLKKNGDTKVPIYKMTQADIETVKIRNRNASQQPSTSAVCRKRKWN